MTIVFGLVVSNPNTKNFSNNFIFAVLWQQRSFISSMYVLGGNDDMEIDFVRDRY